MAQTSGAISHFPSQAVSDSEKQTYEYGKQVAAAIEAEWFTKDSGVGRYFQTREEYHRLRLYARGEQSTQVSIKTSYQLMVTYHIST